MNKPIVLLITTNSDASQSLKQDMEDVLKDIETVSRVRFHKVQEGEWEIFRE